MSRDLTTKAYQSFHRGSKDNMPNSVVTSGQVTNNTILDFLFSDHYTGKQTAQGLMDLAMSLQQVENKLNAIMEKLGITVMYP